MKRTVEKGKDGVNIEKIIEDYLPHNDDVFNEDSALINALKNIIFNELSDAQMRVILLYAEYGKQREVAKMLNVSASTINAYLKRLRKIIAQKLINHGYLDKTDYAKCNRLLCD